MTTIHLDQRALKALALLLHYPDEVLLANLSGLEVILAAVGPFQTDISPFLAWLGHADLLTLEAAHVSVFECRRSTSLHLFEHVHGQSRERGQAMVDLLAMYNAAGLGMVNGELPDYLPAFLEYLSRCPVAEAQPLLAEVAHLVRDIAQNLVQCGSPWWRPCSLLLEMAGAAPVAAPTAPPENPLGQADRARLDREWEEDPVTFNKAPCNPKGQQPHHPHVRHHGRPANAPHGENGKANRENATLC
ncbi:nitrate reductase molybdenum cofactor assembly chaperone [Formicincola oecophyllae]|uniref:Nitrate reductase molybdenum cofactor assembly chaperone n=1 Tax=Formicincola oecophyllae TaxID=2558361 RepID=A0A4Y6U9B3_9PROT|nr:nitrate reductase molybdenum cofactor assembly chaperone [Formicincola oecophyllae]QDH13047.1 nitrate reductase molybdenum cofactor assembly chaperone [Formicincola oecophyllae]